MRTLFEVDRESVLLWESHCYKMTTVDICDNHGDSYDILYFADKIKALNFSEGNSSDYPWELHIIK